MRARFVAVLMVISAFTFIGAAGIAGASASPSNKTAEHIRIMSTKATSRKLSVIATGAVTAGGYDKPGKVTDTVVFRTGQFTFKHVSSSFSASFNSSTCLVTETQKGTFTIGNGTGAYAGIQGSGTFVTSIIAVTAKNHAGQCTHVQAPRTFQGVTRATGTVAL